MELIREVLKRVDSAEVDGRGEALEEVGKNETTLGVLSGGLQRFYVVMDDMLREVEDEARRLGLTDEFVEGRHDECRFAGGSNRRENRRKKQIFQNRIETVKHMFWGAVRREIPDALLNREIALRRGFQVVACLHRHDPVTITIP